ncbi:MAG TPA: hypothetical protein VIO32_09745 [Candidatus Baltobacteraceae bacterium]
MARYTVELPSPAHEMAQEEICKQLPFLAPSISNVRFSASGRCIEFDAPDGIADGLIGHVHQLARRVQRALQNLQRKTIYRTARTALDPTERAPARGVTMLGPGQASLAGVPLRLLRYFDRVFEAFGETWDANSIAVPALIPAAVLARCEYFRSFPQYVTFASHLREDAAVIDAFRSRHDTAAALDASALAHMETPEACLSPALCYHIYHLHQGQRITEPHAVYGVCGKCFRYESTNTRDLRRLWDFTLREIVFLGSRENVLEARSRSMEMMAHFLDLHQLAGEIRTASDPFFISPDAVSKTYFQLTSEAKFEVSLLLPGGARTAVASHNYHSDFFGRAFDITLSDASYMHSVCVGFGLERWVYAFLQQHGDRIEQWPQAVREAPEFRSALA